MGTYYTGCYTDLNRINTIYYNGKYVGYQKKWNLTACFA